MKLSFHKNENSTLKKGFVILFTILITAILLMMGLGIFAIATRETVLSGTAQEAQSAFYAADAGVECGLYAYHLGAFAGGQNPPAVACGAQPGNLTITGTGVSGSPFQFNILVSSQTTPAACAQVSVLTDPTGVSQTIISQGFNICTTPSNGTPTPLRSDPILVERDLQTTYVIGGGLPASATPAGGGTPPVNVIHVGNIINTGGLGQPTQLGGGNIISNQIQSISQPLPSGGN